MEKVEHFRNKYPQFVYRNYSWKTTEKNLHISFDFYIKSGLKFCSKIVIKNVNQNRIQEVGDRVLNNLVFNLGLIELLSYWKTTCSPEIIVKAGSLDESQIEWWKDLILKGMSQFFYENRINFTQENFLNIVSDESRPKEIRFYREELKNETLVPVGGGKDSIVTLEILKKAKKDIACFSLNPTEVTKNVLRIGKIKNEITIERKIDKKLFELNKKGFLNGHTPFSAYLAFLSILLAVIFDKRYIAFSNERSSNEGNLEYRGQIINHQYSKSFEFEKKFRRYSRKYLAKEVEYFSFSRPLYEIQISKLFSKYKNYFSSFLSCNAAFKLFSGTEKTMTWCRKCPKCLFIFTSLYPFLGKEQISKIFGENLFERITLLPTMLALVGETNFKPFECVGTRKESLIAFYLSWEEAMKVAKKEKELPFLLKYFENNILKKHPKITKEAKEIMVSWDKENNLPKSFEKILKQYKKKLYR
jgi:hypothetical protein